VRLSKVGQAHRSSLETTDFATERTNQAEANGAAGLSKTATAAQRGVTLQTVGKSREHFITGRLGALGDAPRSGQRRKLTRAQVEAFATCALEIRPSV
jgi:transposase